MKWNDKDTFTTTASFAGAGAGIAPFAITSQVDRAVAEIGVGIDFVAPTDMSLRLEYEGQFGDNTTQIAGSLKATLPF